MNFILKLSIILICLIFISDAFSPLYYLVNNKESYESILLYSGGKEVELLSCNRSIGIVFGRALCFNDFDGKVIVKQFNGTYTITDFGGSLKKPFSNKNKKK
jgi:hypothetical protein